jgi:transcriptional regulator with XRE-family HTH domain
MAIDERLTGRDLAAERVRAGITQAQLAVLLGVSPQRIANVEGAFLPPATIVHRILTALDKRRARE